MRASQLKLNVVVRSLNVLENWHNSLTCSDTQNQIQFIFLNRLSNTSRYMFQHQAENLKSEVEKSKLVSLFSPNKELVISRHRYTVFFLYQHTLEMWHPPVRASCCQGTHSLEQEDTRNQLQLVVLLGGPQKNRNILNLVWNDVT